jgi:hypothetical protein
LVEWTHWNECQKNTTINPIFSKTKVDNCWSRHILDILFKKWFLLSKVLSLRTITLEEPNYQPTNNTKCIIVTSFTWTYYEGLVFERKKTIMFDYSSTFTHMLVALIEDAYKTTYTRGHVKPWTCYLTTKK